MSPRILSGEMRCLRIYVGESDKFQHKLVWKEILSRARSLGIAGCTVVGGMLSFGAGRRIFHSDFPPDYAIDLPILIEAVDEQPHLDRFLEEVKPWLTGALVTEERALVHHYQPSHSPSAPLKEV